MSAHELELVRSQQREQLLREYEPKVQRRYPRVPLSRRRYVPRRSIDLSRSVVVVGRLYCEFPVRRRGDAHNRVPLSGVAKGPQRGIEDVERENTSLEEVSPRRREQRREVGCSAEVKKRVSRDKYQREPLPQVELSHVALNEVDVHTCCSRSPARSPEHLGRVVDPDGSSPVACDRHDQLSAAARKFKDWTSLQRCQLAVELQVVPRRRKDLVVELRILVEHVTRIVRPSNGSALSCGQQRLRGRPSTRG